MQKLSKFPPNCIWHHTMYFCIFGTLFCETISSILLKITYFYSSIFFLSGEAMWANFITKKNVPSHFDNDHLPQGSTITPDLARPLPNILRRLFSWYGLKSVVGFRSILRKITEPFKIMKDNTKWVYNKYSRQFK